MEAREFEKVFFLFVNRNPKYMSTVKPDYFKVEEVRLMFDASKRHYERFGRPAGRDQLKQAAQLSEHLRDRLKPEYVDIVFDEPYDTLDQEWLQKTCESWIVYRTLSSSLVDAVTYVKGQKVDSDNVQDLVNRVKTIINDRNSVNFSADLGRDFFDPAAHVRDERSLIRSGHRFFDRLAGGYERKTLVVYAGETNIGKSIWLANDATNLIRQGLNVAVVSAEMSESAFMRRLGANLLDVNISEYDRAVSNPDFVAERLAMLEHGTVPPGRLFVKEFPTSAATVLDLEAYLNELQAAKGVRLDAIVVDYINILSNHRNPNSEETYMKIKQLAEDLRAMAVRNEWVVITATQTNRDAYGKTSISIGNVAESAGLTHTADVMFGIIQDAQMKRDNEYWLQILKIRGGGGKLLKCQYRIDYSRMKLHETENLVEDL